MATHATATLIDGMQLAIETGGGHAFIIDSDRPEVGGRDTGPRPVELMTAAVAGCTAMDVISILRKMKQQVTDLKVRVDTEDAKEHPRRFLTVRLHYTLTGFGLDPAKVERAIQLSENRYCPAIATVRAGATVETAFEVREARPEALCKSC
jgi:putative redox protein